MMRSSVVLCVARPPCFLTKSFNKYSHTAYYTDNVRALLCKFHATIEYSFCIYTQLHEFLCCYTEGGIELVCINAFADASMIIVMTLMTTVKVNLKFCCCCILVKLSFLTIVILVIIIVSQHYHHHRHNIIVLHHHHRNNFNKKNYRKLG